MPSKIIVTVGKALTEKYKGEIGIIEELISDLANANPSVVGKVAYIDRADSMAQFGLPPVEKITPQSCKNVVDSLYSEINPDYLLIFGSQDIFPFQQLNNLIYTRTEERLIPSDLPYACTSPYSTRIKDFQQPTRMIGRVPDIPATPDILSVRAIVDSVKAHQPSGLECYQNYFALCSERWSRSTRDTVKSVFGDDSNLICVPGDGQISDKHVASRLHYLNCHGAYRFHGIQGESSDSTRRPDAMFGSNLIGKISRGTVVASGCCYGAIVFPTAKGMKSIPTNYLENGAVAFVGSSTVTYGGIESNYCADWMCKLFLQNILGGMTSGMALLKTRQAFVEKCLSEFEPRNAKVLAQFYLLGDPAIQPVATM